ncbi:hypothetical protein CYMTET_56334 [Cymbomonas tetramitiformis]|uniref:Protein kinase domain-containing protein n=1 Tax=Cymbomonas tetramitiformis TaxID=36881 RepID=A0AAE0BCJ3_9CHLO|nr:hypothetical protein CYMTET_56334 [Cymbomonas tetramitiformis]
MADAPVLTPFLQRSNLNRWPYEHIRRWTSDDTEQGRQGFAESNKLGEGSFGVVYSALDPNTEQRYAVKKVNEMLLQGTAAQQDFARRNFENEVRTLERFRHPNIVNICGYAIQPGTQRTCLVYELLEGGTLESRLRETGPSSLSWQHRVAIALGLAKALNYLQRGQDTKVYHRDVKSANLGLTAAFVPKLLDCGLATHLPQADEPGAPHRAFITVTNFGAADQPGTHPYMCPRLFGTNKYGEVNEIFSFGVVLLELLTGRPPATPEGYLFRDIEDKTFDDPEYLEKNLDAREGVGEWPPELASALCGLARRCIDHLPQRRIQSFQELVRALSALQRTHCFLAPPPEAVAAVEDAENPQQEGRAEHFPQAPQPALPNAEVLQRLGQQHQEQLAEERRRLEQQHQEQHQRLEQQHQEQLRSSINGRSSSTRSSLRRSCRRLEQLAEEQLVEERRRLGQQHQEQLAEERRRLEHELRRRLEQQHQEQLVEERRRLEQQHQEQLVEERRRLEHELRRRMEQEQHAPIAEVQQPQGAQAAAHQQEAAEAQAQEEADMQERRMVRCATRV